MIRILVMAAVVAVLAGCGTSMEVQVVDASTGAPVPNARVVAQPSLKFFPRLSFAGPLEGRTDQGGVATISPELGDTNCILVYAEDFHQSRRFKGEDWEAFRTRARSAPSGTVARYVLYIEPGEYNPKPPMAVVVRVVDADSGRGLAGARVSTRGDPDGGPTNAEGEITLDVDPASTSPPVVVADGFRQRSRPFPEWWRFTGELVPRKRGASGTWVEQMEPLPTQAGR